MMIGNGRPTFGEGDEIEDYPLAWGGLTFEEKMNEVIDSAHHTETSEDKVRNLIMATGAFGMYSMAGLKESLEKVNEELESALNSAYYVPSKVFCTFETEYAQRRCLSALSHGFVTTSFNIGKGRIHPEYLFKGEHILSVVEAPEPAVIFWQDVDLTSAKGLSQQCLTWSLTLILVIMSVGGCKMLKATVGNAGAALWISITNLLCVYRHQILYIIYFSSMTYIDSCCLIIR